MVKGSRSSAASLNWVTAWLISSRETEDENMHWDGGYLHEGISADSLDFFVDN
jgi:hypothetical protein